MKCYNFRTINKKIMGDLLTPVSIYLKIRDIFPQSALLESSDFHTNENSLSYIGIKPIASIEVNKNVCKTSYSNNFKEVKNLTNEYNLSSAIDDFLSHFKIEGDKKKECGLFGYTAYDSIKYLENINIQEKQLIENDAPEILYFLYKYTVIFNHFKNEITIIELVENKEFSEIDNLINIINNGTFSSYNFSTTGKEYSTINDENYLEYVRKGINHCKRGDVFQIVLSRRYVQLYNGDDFKVYRTLRSVNPSPYLFYFDFGKFRIFGSSPETHCKIENNIISIDPIAGTTKRTGNDIIDKELCDKLIKDPKENAEHVMLVDLARNDISRNAKNVDVVFYKEPQYYSHVIHLVSRVKGEIISKTSTIKAFLDTFPAGTLSGAPKVKAMELINKIESHNRGAYGGCIGFIGFDKQINQAITIRSFVSRNNELWYQAGAGIVAKSVPENELQEVNNKLGALKKAIYLATTLND
ncbi:MAG: anthranilate synthase component I family protein [Bacteroidetes bacterium]|nr:anthranilate synthase component I family protein [Bacteroidota bacterium]